jgi:hypothetical protein
MAQEAKKSYVVFGVWNIMIQDYFVHRGDHLEVLFTENSSHPHRIAIVDNPFEDNYFMSRGCELSQKIAGEFWEVLRQRSYAAFVEGMITFQKEVFAFFQKV